MKLKLDLHPIYNDSAKIEQSLNSIIDEACEKRAAEIEIIPGKGSGALKKSVLRFLDRPEIKVRYHRLEKDSDNFGRVFVHFRWDKSQEGKQQTQSVPKIATNCFCCDSPIEVDDDFEDISEPAVFTLDCGSCGSPNKITVRQTKTGKILKSESGYV